VVVGAQLELHSTPELDHRLGGRVAGWIIAVPGSVERCAAFGRYPGCHGGDRGAYGIMARTVMGVNSQTSSVIDPAEWVEYAAREHPRRLFLRTLAGRQLSYEALREQSARLASALLGRGVASGDRVAARVEKSAEAVLLYVACLRLGAVFVPINPACTPNELEYLLCDSSPRLAIVPPGERDMLAPLADRAGIQCLETLGADGNGSLSELARLCNPDRQATAHMRLFVSGSAPLPIETHQEFLRRTDQVILERYGMTETLINASNPYDGPRVPGSVGPALPGIAIRVTNRDSGTVEPKPDVIGTLEIAGPNVFAGYWRDPDKTSAEFTADGWFKTGDLGRIDRDGYVHIAGRVKDLVISAGCNVYPREVESELEALPGVAESAVFGAPHPDFGEGVTAVIVPEPGAVLSEAQLIESLSRRLARYKVPKRVLLVAELPRNAMGKVQKDALRATYASLY